MRAFNYKMSDADQKAWDRCMDGEYGSVELNLMGTCNGVARRASVIVDVTAKKRQFATNFDDDSVSNLDWTDEFDYVVEAIVRLDVNSGTPNLYVEIEHECECQSEDDLLDFEARAMLDEALAMAIEALANFTAYVDMSDEWGEGLADEDEIELPVVKPLRVSDLEAFLQCPRRMWLERRGSELSPPAPTDAMNFKQRHDQDALRNEFQIHIERRFPARQAHFFSRSANPKETSQTRGFGGSFTLDAFVAEPHAIVQNDGLWHIFSSRASTTAPNAPRADSDHIFAVATQAWVFQKSTGARVHKISIAYLNKEFTLPAAGQPLTHLFIEVDVTAQCAADIKELDRKFHGWIAAMRNTLAGDEPKLDMGDQCKKGRGCPLLEHCKEAAPDKQEHPIDLLPDSAGKGLAKTLKAAGILSILNALPDQLVSKSPLTAQLYRRIQTAHTQGTAVLDGGAKTHLDQLAYPRYYFDFEGIDFALPLWLGITPYTQIPFQWSCHVETSSGLFEHHEFLDLSGEDPSLRCVEAMLKVMPIGDHGKIFVYFAGYEKSRIEELAERHPEHREALLSYCERLEDLLPLVKQNYYHPEMKGSFSIKKVLPAIAPHLDYSELDGVQDGIGAQVSYLRAILNPNSAEERQSREQLLRYCRQDTWALVVIARFLAGQPLIPDECLTLHSFSHQAGKSNLVPALSQLRICINHNTLPHPGRAHGKIIMATSTVNWSAEQQTVLNLPPGRHLVLAPPGSGKTELLAERFRARTNASGDSDSALCVTFTNRAARNMIDRIGGALGRSDFVGTLHSFAFKFLTANDLLPAHTSILEQKERDALLEDAVEAAHTQFAEDPELVLNTKRGAPPDLAFLKHLLLISSGIAEERSRKVDWLAIQGKISTNEQFDLVKCPFLLKDAWLEEIKLFVRQGKSNKSFWQAMMAHYAKAKAAQHCVDFDDLLTRCTHALVQNMEKPDPEIKMASYGWIQLDEAQDFNPLQWLILLLLSGQASHLVAFGDLHQSIYAFMGAQYDLIERFKKTASSVHSLKTNFRSNSGLVDRLNGFAHQAFGSGFVPMAAQNNLPVFGDVIKSCSLPPFYGKNGDPAEVKTIMAIAKSRPHASIAVLTRTGRYAQSLSKLLDGQGQAHSLLSSELDVFETRSVSNVMSILAAHLNPMRKEGWARLLFLYGVASTRKEARKLLNAMLEVGMHPSDWLGDWNPDRQVKPSFMVDRFAERINSNAFVVIDTETTGLNPEVDDIIQLSGVKPGPTELAEFNSYLLTVKTIPKEVSEVNHIDAAILAAKGVARASAFDGFKTFCSERFLVGHNIRFDLRMLDANFPRDGVAPMSNDREAFDTLSVAQLLIERGDEPGQAKNHKLGSLMDALGIDQSKFNLHNALDDVKATEQVARKLADIAIDREEAREALAIQIRQDMKKFRQKIQDAWTYLRHLSDNPQAPIDYGKTFIEVDRLSWTSVDDGTASPEFNAGNIAKVSRFLRTVKKPTRQNQPMSFASFAEFFNDELAHYNEADLLTPDNRLVLSTIHKSKGLEFDVVIIAGFKDYYYPATFMGKLSNASSPAAFAAEEQRVLYVALTRAINQVFLLSTTGSEPAYMNWLHAPKAHAIEAEVDLFSEH